MSDDFKRRLVQEIVTGGKRLRRKSISTIFYLDEVTPSESITDLIPG